MSKRPLLSVVAPTIGRGTLERMLASIRDQASARDVEIVVVGDTHRGNFRTPLRAVARLCAAYAAGYVEHDGGQHCVGQPQRNYGMQVARGEWLAFLQDDDVWPSDAWAAIRASLAADAPCPRLFRVRTQWGHTVWERPELRCGNLDADGIVVPNDPARLGRWAPTYAGDYDFAAETVAAWGGVVRWEPAVLAVARP